eukprot:TRINITY_DN4552_c0_g1_i2.p1 TRINITY_DN4552_c0_g1~~TRINITY_DN4552_c0_g1_i2.p1  ORF type:complete len:285 (-),score=47.32 TRINITY_DN4552_c0_g1_i2:115-969(-)
MVHKKMKGPRYDDLMKILSQKLERALIEVSNDAVWSQCFVNMVRPTDAVFSNENNYKPVLQKEYLSNPKDAWYNTREKGLALLSAKDIVKIITESNDCMQQIRKYTEHQIPSLSIQVMRWQITDPKFKFRCFIFERKLRAVTHIETYRNFGLTGMEIPDIQNHIISYIEELLPNFKIDDIIIDLYVYPHPIDIRILNIHPFWKHTNPCLFNWEEDINILLHSNRPVYRYCNEANCFVVPYVENTIGATNISHLLEMDDFVKINLGFFGLSLLLILVRVKINEYW